jgi:hypothetical protein
MSDDQTTLIKRRTVVVERELPQATQKTWRLRFRGKDGRVRVRSWATWEEALAGRDDLKAAGHKRLILEDLREKRDHG